MKIFTSFVKMLDSVFRNENHILSKIILSIVTFVIIAIFLLLSKQQKIAVGQKLKNDIIAEFEEPYIDMAATENNEKLIRLTTAPVFILDEKLASRRIQLVKDTLNSIYNSEYYAEIEEFIRTNSLAITKSEYKILVEIMDKYEDFITVFIGLYESRYTLGVVELEDDMISKIETSGVLIRKAAEGEVVFSAAEISKITLDDQNNKELLDSVFKKYTQTERDVLISFFNTTLIPNIIYDKAESEKRLARRMERERNVYKKIKKGELFPKGLEITRENIEKVRALYRNRDYESISLKELISNILALVLLFVFAFFYINYQNPKMFTNIKNYLLLSTLLTFYVVYISFVLPMATEHSFFFHGLFVPVSAFTLTFYFLYSKSFSITMTIILSLLFYLLSGFNHEAFLFLFFSGISSVLIMSRIKKRIELLVAGILISLVNLLPALSLSLLFNVDNPEILYNLAAAGLNGIGSAILAIFLILIGETVLNSPTVFRLQELSDASSPIMKELFDHAVGTYNHSILVANLAEAAANEIGADGLLARVGGYYHDIGKIGNAEYFVENQGDFNIHDQLKPSMSATIIKSHVRKGVDRARKARLPLEIIDIITQHHGNSLIKYFYSEALKSHDSSKEEIQKDLYHYKEKNPQFHEAAIVMLSDQVEAACRSLKKPTMSSVEKLIYGIVEDKFSEGILDDSGLTLKDLTKIKKVFVKLILGMYHSRIEYPDKTEKKDVKKDKENPAGVHTKENERDVRVDNETEKEREKN